MKSNMIMSASGWRKVFVESMNEQDDSKSIGEENKAICIFAAKVFSDYVKEFSTREKPIIVLGMDTRPTGLEMAIACLKSLIACGVNVKYIGIAAAPEIMAYSKNSDGFLYISASHNPIGHNGIKFGLNSGGVLAKEENEKLIKAFKLLCESETALEDANKIVKNVSKSKVKEILDFSSYIKIESLAAYKNFSAQTITASCEKSVQDEIFSVIRKSVEQKKIGIVCDMNGSARTKSIDEQIFAENKINFYPINNVSGKIVHEIIPEDDNLRFVADEMLRLQKNGKIDAVLGYMPDCDGDRGNLVYWNCAENKTVVLRAQEVFSLSVLAELSYSAWFYEKFGDKNKPYKPAIVVNCPTSMRIEEIACKFGAKVFRSEVGEANVVNLAKQKREEGYTVRIFGEGSNGGTITYPSSVRDPINTVFAILKLLCIKDLYCSWCSLSGSFYSDDFTLSDILESLPVYTTTGVSESRAILHIHTKDNAILKSRFQNVFLNEWNVKKDLLYEKYGILFWECVITNGTVETRRVNDFSKSGNGGLKIIFYNEENAPLAFIWMRGSATEPVFRIMCDVKGYNPEMEKELLQWETQMLFAADK